MLRQKLDGSYPMGYNILSDLAYRDETVPICVTFTD